MNYSDYDPDDWDIYYIYQQIAIFFLLVSDSRLSLTTSYMNLKLGIKDIFHEF